MIVDVRPLVLVCSLLTTMLAVGCGEQRGSTIRELPSPARLHSAEPHLARGPDGTIALSWQEREGEDVVLRYSVLDQDHWQRASTVARGHNWFVNWADFSSVVPITPELWAAHWLVKRPGDKYAYDVAIALSRDSGMTWGEPITPHNDGTATEHGFVSLFPWQGGVGALWLDGRNMGASNDNGESGSADGGMTLRSTVVERPSRQSMLVDELVCDCCQTDVAVGPSGPIAVFRNRTRNEIRDIYIARAVDGQWQPVQPVARDGWEIGGCPVNGPAIAANGSNVAVAWFTAAEDRPLVRLAFSRDGGIAFSPPVDIDTQRPVGRVDVEWIDDGEIAVSWVRARADGTGDLCVRRVSIAGRMSAEQVVTETSTERLSGFPQMIRHGEDLVFAWTDASGDTPTVRTALLDVGLLKPLAVADGNRSSTP